MSDIRVFVAFPASTVVFAGETLQCKITFKNISQKAAGGTGGATNPSRNSSVSSESSLAVSNPDRRSRGPPLQIPPGDNRRVSPRLPASRPPSAGYKPPPSASKPPPSASKPPPLPTPSPTPTPGANRHKRSVSIVSLSSDIGDAGGLRSPSLTTRPRGHGRSASLQIPPGRPLVNGAGAAPSSGISPPNYMVRGENLD